MSLLGELEKEGVKFRESVVNRILISTKLLSFRTN